jgi:hypothetical protein
VVVLLTNIMTCISDRDNQVVSYFNCKPPTLLKYLGNVSQRDSEVPIEDIVNCILKL